MMCDIKIPKEAISRQIANSVDLIVQVKRLRDGSRRTTNITEVIGMEGDVIVTQELFKFEYLDETRRRQDHRRISLDGPSPLHAREGQAVRLRPAVSGGLPLIFRSRRGLLQAPYRYVFNKRRSPCISSLPFRKLPASFPSLPEGPFTSLGRAPTTR